MRRCKLTHSFLLSPCAGFVLATSGRDKSHTSSLNKYVEEGLIWIQSLSPLSLAAIQCWNFRTFYRNRVGIGLVVLPDRQATYAGGATYVGGVDSLESIPGLHKSLKECTLSLFLSYSFFPKCKILFSHANSTHTVLFSARK
jgi:hypothetical protein